MIESYDGIVSKVKNKQATLYADMMFHNIVKWEKKHKIYLHFKNRENIHILFLFIFLKKKALIASREENWVLEDTVKGKGLLDVGVFHPN